MTARLAPLATCLFLLSGCSTDAPHADEPTMEELTALFGEAAEQVDDPGKVDDPGCNGVIVPDQSGFERRVALTFDDGPDPVTTPQVMEILRRRDVPATFFINGNRVTNAERTAIVEEIAADPLFILANHTWSHPRNPFLDQMDGPEMAAQIDDVTSIMSAAGESSRYFRFPFGRARCGTANAVRERGYIITGWHVDSADWCYAGGRGKCEWDGLPEVFRDGDMLGYVMQQVRRRNGGVVLFHDIHRFTADALEGVIDALVAEGYSFTSVDDVETFPRLNGLTPPPQRFIGDACASDMDCNFESGAFCLSAGFCTTSCTGYCPDRMGYAGTFCVEDTEGATEAEAFCVLRATEGNEFCGGVPGSERVSRDRYLGEAGIRPSTADVCAPAR
ncbi:MAG: polysaccharide deacetylase family protein [Sandaracinaceae bacterium]|nr:MAG: polysaccharide deacetylase family protein [Sandaracinaceae bacterium]